MQVIKHRFKPRKNRDRQWTLELTGHIFIKLGQKRCQAKRQRLA